MDPDRIRVSDIDIQWDPARGSCAFQGLPVAMMWVDTTLAGLMSGVQTMVGTERFLLALQSEGRKSVAADWTVISAYPDFPAGFVAISTIAAVAGWGTWELVSVDEREKSCKFRAGNTWEGRYQKALGVCWGSGMLAGKLAGYCSRLFDANCWADQTSFIARGDAHDEFDVSPSSRSLESEIESLLAADGAARADMAVALRRLEREISERRRMEEALRESEERWQYALEGAGDGVWDWNARTNEVYFSRRWKEMLGFTEGEIGNSLDEWDKRIHPDDHERVQAEITRHFDGRVPVYVSEHRVRCKDGSYKWILDRGKVVSRTPEGLPLRVIGTHADLTALKEAEAALRESEARFRAFVETSADWIWAIDIEGRHTYTNDRVRDILGIEPDELLGAPAASLVHPEDAPAVQALLAKSIAAKKGWAGHLFRWRHRDGSWRWLESSAVAIVDSRGVVIGFRGTDRDITERKRVEAERIELERTLLHAQKLESLGILAGGIAHDFNNLLMAIQGNLELVALDAPEASPTRTGIDQALQATRRAADLTRQMLAYAGKGRFVVRPLDLNELVRENGNLFRTAIPRSVTIDLRLAKAPCRIEADAGQIQQVIMNLITNAAEALGGNAGVVTLATGVEWCGPMELGGSRLAERPDPGYFAYLEVADNGCGMGSETTQRIFDPFFSTKSAGRGLGMSAVLGVVRGHHGAIFVDSALGIGTTIRVLLPSSSPGDTDSQEAVRPSAQRADALRGGLVLVVDDEKALRDLCTSYLRRLGFETVCAADGEEALARYRDCHAEIACVLLDLSMPARDGISTFRELRRLYPHVKVILCSGYNEQDAVQRYTNEGLAGFLQKPYRLSELRAEILAALRG